MIYGGWQIRLGNNAPAIFSYYDYKTAGFTSDKNGEAVYFGSQEIAYAGMTDYMYIQ